jgi:cytochrome c553
MLRRTVAVALSCLVWMSMARAEDHVGERAPDTMQARVLGCAACHGGHGEGTNNDYFPRLAGKPAGYLYNQLIAFRDGQRQYPPMNYLLAYLPDAYLRKIADYFAAQRPPYPPPLTPAIPAALLARGAQLVKSGDPANDIPACAACHGAALTGREPGIPGLLGLHAEYVSAQLGAWRNGTRRAHAPDCMATIAGRLSLADVAAISGWLASEPIPDDATPAPDVPHPMPLACGSEPERP